MTSTPRKAMVFDADGVMIDYNKAYPFVYERAFGKPLPCVRPDAYHAHNAYGLELVPGTPEHDQFFAHFDYEAWASMPLLPGVAKACQAIVEAGYDIICVTSIPTRFEDARRENFRRHNLPIKEVITTDRHGEGNPKQEFLVRLRPVAFVDNLHSNFDGVPPDVHTALIEYGHYDSPNLGQDTCNAHSTHHSLADFVYDWLMQHH